MTFSVFARLLSCAGLAAIVSAPALAASDSSDAFIANIRLRAAFLVQAGELAKDHAGSDKVRQFAAMQKDEQAAVLGLIDGEPAPAAPSVVAELSQPTTGRSAAKDTTVDLASFTAPAGVGALMPAAAVGLEQLSSLKGEAFDALYTRVARGVIGDLAAYYDAYGKTGDDVALRAMATRELPRMTADAAALD